MSKHPQRSTGAMFVVLVGAAAAVGMAAVLPRVQERVVAKSAEALRPTGMPQAISFYRHFSFNVPRTVTTLGIGMLLGIATIRLYLLAAGSQPTYLAVYFGLVGGCATLASLGMLAGHYPRVVMGSWALGSVVSLATFAMYLVSRTIGLPELGHYVSRWDFPLGTAGIALSCGFLALHFTVVTGMTVAFPWQQEWHR